LDLFTVYLLHRCLRATVRCLPFVLFIYLRVSLYLPFGLLPFSRTYVWLPPHRCTFTACRVTRFYGSFCPVRRFPDTFTYRCYRYRVYHAHFCVYAPRRTACVDAARYYRYRFVVLPVTRYILRTCRYTAFVALPAAAFTFGLPPAHSAVALLRYRTCAFTVLWLFFPRFAVVACHVHCLCTDCGWVARFVLPFAAFCYCRSVTYYVTTLLPAMRYRLWFCWLPTVATPRCYAARVYYATPLPLQRFTHVLPFGCRRCRVTARGRLRACGLPPAYHTRCCLPFVTPDYAPRRYVYVLLPFRLHCLLPAAFLRFTVLVYYPYVRLLVAVAYAPAFTFIRLPRYRVYRFGLHVPFDVTGSALTTFVVPFWITYGYGSCTFPVWLRYAVTLLLPFYLGCLRYCCRYRSRLPLPVTCVTALPFTFVAVWFTLPWRLRLFSLLPVPFCRSYRLPHFLTFPDSGFLLPFHAVYRIACTLYSFSYWLRTRTTVARRCVAVVTVHRCCSVRYR